MWAIIANTAVWALLTVALGGNALGHKVAEGHHYLLAKHSETEVSQLVFTYSFWHSWISVVAVVLSVPIAWLAYPKAS